jgi:chromosome segregation protein
VIGFNEQLKEAAIRETEKAINQLINQLYAVDNKIENIQSTETRSQHRLEELEQQIQTTSATLEQNRQKHKEAQEQLTEMTGKTQESDESFRQAEETYNTANREYNEFNLNLTRQQSKVTGLKQELDFKRNQLTALKTQIETNTTQLGETATQIVDADQRLKTAGDEMVALLGKKEVDEKVLNESDQAYYNLRNVLTEKESGLRHKQKEKEQTDLLINEIKDKLNDLKLQLSGTKERLSVEFKVNIEDVIEEPRTGDESLDDLQASVDRMKKRIENLGEVNPTAIEAFEEMRKRYEFIEEQKNDLVTAKESLLQTIQEVEATANQRFLDTFNQVRENFQKVFKALFTEEDTADMVLENPENLAETGIDIVAKPKGKRPSSITQLSGGEKTLTATAMLFAIYLIKPAPFCILDEVDAPLDDANVSKFTNMIRQFSENSQFIIVTHNKMTMSAVDVIYGVTMQEAGVSKLVPVDFRGLN